MSFPTPSLINEVDMELMLLVIRGYTSSYSLWNYTQENKTEYIKPVAYKNVNQRFLRLARLRYLEETPIGGDNPHRRIDYKLTMQGLEQLIPYILNHLNVIKELVQYMDKFGLDKKGFGDILMRKATSTNEVVKRYFELTGLQQVTNTALSEFGLEKAEINTSPMTIEFIDYLVQVSTFEPVNLDEIKLNILEILAYEKSLSRYQIFKVYNTNPDYVVKAGEWIPANLHNKITLGKIEPKVSEKEIDSHIRKLTEAHFIKEYYNKDKKYYMITLYGLLMYVTRVRGIRNEFFIKNKDNILIKSLILQFFEEKTIKSLEHRYESFVEKIRDYFYNCCDLTEDYCKVLRTTSRVAPATEVEKPHFPSNTIIQHYMMYLGGKEIDNKQLVLNEIKKYHQKIKMKWKDSEFSQKEYELQKDPEKRDWRQAPAPLDLMYSSLFDELNDKLKELVRELARNILASLGRYIKAYKNEEMAYQDIESDHRDLETESTWDPIFRYIFNDKKLMALAIYAMNDSNRALRQIIYHNRRKLSTKQDLKLSSSITSDKAKNLV